MNLNELKEQITNLQSVLTEAQGELYALNDTFEALESKLNEAEELLASLKFDDNPEFDSSENGFVIRRGMLLEYYGTDTEVVIPDSVIKIGEGAFKNRTSIVSVVIPESVEEIGNDAFYGCSALECITITERLTKIGSFAFSQCPNLSKLKGSYKITYDLVSAFHRSNPIRGKLEKKYKKELKEKQKKVYDTN